MSVPNEVKNLIHQFYQIITIIIKNGSGSIKVGFSGDDEPKSFPTIVGIPKYQGVVIGMQQKDAYIGYEATTKRGILTLKRVIESGIVISWDYMEKIWHKTFKHELLITSKGCNVLLTDKPLNPKANREKMTQIMFETHHVNGLYIAVDAMLALYASGRYTGIVIDCGYSVGHTVPIYEGYVLQHAVQRLDFGGKDMTMYLMKILTETGYSFTTSQEMEWVKDIKEKFSYVALDYEYELIKGRRPSDMERDYELPDGQTVTIGTQRFRTMELLFNPGLMGRSAPGIHSLSYNSVMFCDKDLRKQMYENILLSGGCCNAQGMAERVKKEMTNLAPASIKVNIVDLANKHNLSWIGGSILSSTESFLDLMITTDEYNEYGQEIVHRKCF